MTPTIYLATDQVAENIQSNYPALARIRKLMEERIPWFPHNRCDIASEVVQAIVGLPMVSGYYIDRSYSSPIHSYHCWNYDPTRELYIDITRDQFHERYTCPPINIVRSNHPNYIFSDEKTIFLRELRTPPSDIAQRLINQYDTKKIATK